MISRSEHQGVWLNQRVSCLFHFLTCRMLQDSEGLPELPDAAVLSILQHMPLQQRLRCALVCRCWTAAASLIPAELIENFNRNISDKSFLSGAASARMAGCLQAWLDSNSAKVTSIHVNQYGNVCEIQVIYYTPLRLRSDAMPQLSCLKLSNVTLVLESNARNNGSGNPPLSGTDNSINDCGNNSVSALAQLGTSTTRLCLGQAEATAQWCSQRWCSLP
jgi:hypothetical protein